jgi:hypothetical protein
MCGEVLQCSDVLLVFFFFFIVVYMVYVLYTCA